MTEVDLPRGGSIVEKKDKRPREAEEDDGLFKKKPKTDDKKKGKGKREDLPEGHQSAGKENAFEGVWRSPITSEVMVEGVLGLGYVTEIRTSDIVLETASSFRVVLPITEMGPHAIAEVKADRLQLEEAFPIGHSLPFRIIPKPKAAKTKPANKNPQAESAAVRVTIDPALINKHLGPTTIAVGLAMAAEVKSVEEKGLHLDLGLKNTSAFLANDLLPNGFLPKVGLPLVVRIQSTANMRMLQVALAVEMDTLSQEAISSLSLRSLMPGTVILATPLQTKKEGAYVALGNGVNAWLPRRAMPPRIRASIESFVRPLRVVVLLCQQNSRLLCVSAHPDIVAVSRAEKRRNFEGVHLGDLVRCTVTRCGNGKVEMALVKEDEEEAGRGALVTVTATKASLESAADETRYKAGTVHEMRVLGLKIVERTIAVGNTREILKQPMVSYHDAKVGAKVSVVIKKLTKAGIHVLIFNRIRGFIPIRYLSDTILPSVEKAFPVDDSIACRVLTASEEHRNILLTARKAQVSDTGELITDLARVKPGQTCVGVVVYQFPKGGVLVSFYDDIRGMLSSVECRKKKNLQIGDALAVRVVSVDRERNRLELAVADGTLPSDVVVRAKEASLVSATALTGTVASVAGGSKKRATGVEGVVVDVESSSLTISPALLSDSLDSPYTTGAVDEILPPAVLKKEQLQLLPLGCQSGLHRATSKRFIVEWAAKVGGLPTRVEEMHTGMIVPGVVNQRVVDFGYTIELPGGSGLLGRVPFAAISEGKSGERALSIGQTVVVRLTGVEPAKKRVDVALEWSSPSAGFSVPLALLRSSIEEQRWLAAKHGLPQLGAKLSGVVVQVLEDLCLLKVAETGAGGRPITAYARKGNFEHDKIKKDGVVSALCVDYVWPRGDVEVVIVEGGEAAAAAAAPKKGKKKEAASASSSSSTPRVIVARRDYLGVLVESGGGGGGERKVVYAPSRAHPNHVNTPEEVPAVGSPLALTGAWEKAGNGEGEGGLVWLAEREGEGWRAEKAAKDMAPDPKAAKKGAAGGGAKKSAAKIVDDEADGDDSNGRVAKFGIYKGRIEGAIALPRDEKKAAAERARCAVHVRLPGAAIGRLHVSEFPARFLAAGGNPMEAFLAEYQHRAVHVLTMTMKHAEIDGRKYPVCDVTLDEAKLSSVKKSKNTVDYKNKFHVGEIVPVYYSAHGVRGQLVYEVNPRWRALVDRPTEKLAVVPDFGSAKSAKILSINKQSCELKVVLVENMKLQPGTVCAARFKSYSFAPIKTLMTVSSGEVGLLSLTAVADDFERAVARMAEIKALQELLEVRLLSQHAGGAVHQWVLVAKERSAKRAGVRDPLIKSRDDVTEGTVVRGFVAYIKKDEVKIEIGPGVLAELMPESAKRSDLRVNDLVSARVVEVDEDGDVLVEVEEVVQAHHKPERKRLSSTASDGASETPKKRLREAAKGGAEQKKAEGEQRVVKERKELSDPGFDWDSAAFSMDAMAAIGGLKIDAKEEEKMEADVKRKEGVEKKKKKSEMTAAEVEVEKEKKLSAKERAMMEGAAALTSDGDYQRALKGDPNAAALWIQYMSYFIGKDELAKARATAERALVTINYREDAELFSLWCAYVNLEVAFGDASTWTAVFTRACDSADSFKMHKHMAAALAENQKWAETDAIFEKLVKKFRANSDEVWHLYGEYLYSNGREEEARALMARALECIPKTRHVAVITKFASLEFSKGDEEKGRNLFENLLATYPKRTEVWAEYAELAVKHADVEQARHVLERVTSLPLSVFKLRPFYKKWIELETQEGDEASLAEVKKKALQYLTSLKEIVDE